MRIYINERIEEETFLEYIKNKFNFSELIPLGYGAEGITYQINSKKILKLTRTYPKKYESLVNKKFKNLMNIYTVGEIEIPSKFLKKHEHILPNYFIPFQFGMKKYNLNNIVNGILYYVISEKLNEIPDDRKNLVSKLVDMVDDYMVVQNVNITSYNKIYDFFFNNEEIDISAFDQDEYELIEDVYIRLINGKDKLNEYQKDILIQLLNGFKELTNNGYRNFDFHLKNIMMNNNGDIKLIDYNDSYVPRYNIENIESKKYPMKNRLKK